MCSAQTARAPSPFGQQIRHWRRVRGLSQLGLALQAQVSPRHVSFIETGRSRPSRRVVLQLAEALAVPSRECNELLHAAGLPSAFSECGLSDEAMAPFRSVIARMLRQQEPYLAFVIDRLWNVVDANAAARILFPEIGGAKPVNAVRLFLGPGSWRDATDNFAEVGWAVVERLRREAAMAGPDAELQQLLAEAEAFMRDVPSPFSDPPPDVLAVCPRLRAGGRRLSLVSAVARFGAARDITLQELRVELIFPADEETERFFRELPESLRASAG